MSSGPQRLLDQGAILVDIREADEHARDKIIGARHLALSKLDEANLALPEGQPVIFHCKSGARTIGNASRLAQSVGGAAEAFIIEGGLDAWKKAGMPVAGSPGSLQARFPDLTGRVRAKTGYISNVDSLSGYVTLADGREVVFSIIVNGTGLSSARVRTAIDDVVRAIAAGA